MMLARPDKTHPDVPALQIEDAADCFAGEELEAARMHPGQQDNRFAAFDRDDRGTGKSLAEIRFSAPELGEAHAPGT